MPNTILPERLTKPRHCDRCTCRSTPSPFIIARYISALLHGNPIIAYKKSRNVIQWRIAFSLNYKLLRYNYTSTKWRLFMLHYYFLMVLFPRCNGVHSECLPRSRDKKTFLTSNIITDPRHNLLLIHSLESYFSHWSVGSTVFRGKFDKFRDEFGKFRGSPRQGRWNSAVHRGYTFKFPRID